MNLRSATNRPNKLNAMVAVSYLEGYYMLEDIRRIHKLNHGRIVAMEKDGMGEHIRQSDRIYTDHVGHTLSLIDKYKEALDILNSKVNEDNGNCTTIIIRNDIWEKILALK